MQKKWGIKKIAKTLLLRLKKSNNHVNDCEETLKKVMLALDGELTNEEEAVFLAHINTCSRCLEKYDIERSFKQFLSEKISRRKVSITLVEQIRIRILGKASD